MLPAQRRPEVRGQSMPLDFVMRTRPGSLCKEYFFQLERSRFTVLCELLVHSVATQLHTCIFLLMFFFIRGCYKVSDVVARAAQQALAV